MLLNKDVELKKAVLSLPEQEKDKLLVRLISKDLMLMNQLRYRLLEDSSDLEERIQSVSDQIDRQLEQLNKRITTGYINDAYKTKDLLSVLRSASGLINEHVTITRDKVSDVSLRLHLIEKSVEYFGNFFSTASSWVDERLLDYQTGRIKYVLDRYVKLHEDLQFDYRDNMNKVLHFAYHSALVTKLKQIGLPDEV